MIIGSNIEGIEVTREMVEAVALAHLYREDPMTAMFKSTSQRFKKGQSEIVLKAIVTDPSFKQIQDDIVSIEEQGLVSDNLNTVMLQYNRLLQKAQEEGKYEVAARILKEIRQIKAIENEQTKFEVIITVEEPKDKKDDVNE